MNGRFRYLTVAFLTAAGSLTVSSSWASMTNARFAAHYKPKFVPTETIPYLCDDPATRTVEPNYSPNFTLTPCTQYTTQGPLGPGTVYAVVAYAGSEGVAAVSFGINYDGGPQSGIDPELVTWTACADGLSFPNGDGVHGDFPQPGGGIRLTWLLPGSCQAQVIANAGVHAVVGAFYIYAFSDAILQFTPNNNLQSGPEFAIADCGGVETNVLNSWPQGAETMLMSRIGFGSSGGLNACLVTAVSTTTWGKLKSMYPGAAAPRTFRKP